MMNRYDMNAQAKVFTLYTNYNAKGLTMKIVTTTPADTTLDAILTLCGLSRKDLRKYEVSSIMPLQFALAYSHQRRVALGIE